MLEAYAKIEDVKPYHPGKKFDTTGAITLEQVQSWLILDTGYINSHLQYVVDVTDLTEAGTAVLVSINARLTAHRIDETNPNINAGLRTEKTKPRNLRKSALEDLESIKNKKLPIASKWKPMLASLYTSEDPPDTCFTKECTFD